MDISTNRNKIIELQCQIDDDSNNGKQLMINYAIAGNGTLNILCLPGALGCWETDFKSVLETFDGTKMTLICCDAPGYGRSRPPDRQFGRNSNQRDAECAFRLMQNLGRIPFSILGWSDGGVTALFVAHKHADSVQRLVIWGATSYLTDDIVAVYRCVGDTTKWSATSRDPYIRIYGEQYFHWAWNSHLQARIELFENDNGDKCRWILPTITRPVLIIHGDNDIFVPKQQSDYLLKSIPNSKMLIKSDGGHNLHIQHSDWFRSNVTDFLFDSHNSS